MRSMERASIGIAVLAMSACVGGGRVPEPPPIAGTYEIRLCKVGRCGFRDTAQALTRGTLVLLPGLLPPLPDSATHLLHQFSGTANGCYALEVPRDGSNTYAGIGGVGAFIWNQYAGPEGRIGFSLYNSPDASHRVVAQVVGGSLRGVGLSGGAGIVDVSFSPDSVIGQRTGPADITSCVTVSARRWRALEESRRRVGDRGIQDQRAITGSGAVARANGTLTGRVNDTLGRGINGGIVVLRMPSGEVWNSATTDSLGAFVLRDVPSGTYQGTANHIGYVSFSWSQRIRDRATDSVTVVLHRREVNLTPVCSTQYARGLELEIRDSRTGVPAAEGAVAIARDRWYVDTLPLIGWDAEGRQLYVGGLHERPGVYSVTVQKPGYRDWLVDRLELTRDECHVNTQRLRVHLEPIR